LGDDVYGHPEFENEYSEMGHFLHLFKYKNEHDRLFDIVELVKPFLLSWQAMQEVSFVLPVPSSKVRIYQPAQEIASEIASLIKVGYSSEILQKKSSIESKGLSASGKQQIQGTIVKTAKATKEHNMLLVDDLYKSGATLTECIRVLREDPMINKIFVLTMTKTRKG